MKISFDYLQENSTQIEKTGRSTSVIKTENVKENLSGVLFGKGLSQEAYAKQGKTMQSVQEKAGLFNGQEYKNYMAVMSSTMSEEDFSALLKEGVKPEKTDVKDTVTIMDHIKTVMAKSGVVISGFNSGSDISMEKLEAMTGNKAYAQAMANEFASKDLPLTESNITETVKQTDRMMEIDSLSDDAKQYLIENSLELTIDNLYKARYSVSGAQSKGSQAGGYFADNLSGYYGKAATQQDLEALNQQIDKVIEEAGLIKNDETRAQAGWLLERGMLLTTDNLSMLEDINQLKIPMNREMIIDKIAQALQEGKEPKEANLVKDGIYKKAEKIKAGAETISDGALASVVEKNGVLNLLNLTEAQRRIEAGDMVSSSMREESFLTAKRTLEEVRLQMTISANVMLIKSNYSIETAQLSDLVEELKAAEEKSMLTKGLSMSKSEDHKLFTQSLQTAQAICKMPAALVGKMSVNQELWTLTSLHKQGQILQDTYKRAGESYEALMTMPRADLGDRIADAFSNVDDILEDLAFPKTKENQRAVRILGYNSQKINEENIMRIKAADEKLCFLLEKMTPQGTLQMIRDGRNPLEESIEDLTQYFMQKESDLESAAESYSRFLYRLDKENDITPEEREAYIGIYRLIHQIEKGDRRAIGRIVAGEMEMTFSNLLSMIRSEKRSGMNVFVDDSFGLVSEIRKQEKTPLITDQIQRYFEMKALEISHQELEPSEKELIDLQRKTFLETMTGSEEMVEYLIANKADITPNHLQAAKNLTQKRGEMYRVAKKCAKEAADEEKLLKMFDEIEEGFTEYDKAQERVTQMYKGMEAMLDNYLFSDENGHLDLSSILAVSKQISLSYHLSKQENYELPLWIEGQLTGVNVRFMQAKAEEGKESVRIHLELPSGGEIMANFKISGDLVSGYVGCDKEDKLEYLEQKREEFNQNILLKTGKMADINFIYSKDLKITPNEQLRQAGKPAEAKTESEEVQGSHTSAKDLYLTAKEFLNLLKD